jgi:hypothetical protein
VVFDITILILIYTTRRQEQKKNMIDSLLGFSRRGRRSGRLDSTGILGLLLSPARIARRGWRSDGKVEGLKMGASSHSELW